MKENSINNPKLPSQKYCSDCSYPINIEIPEGDTRNRAVCSKCKTVFYENPKIVAGCLLTWKNKILLCKRANEPRSGFWTLPAGFMENHETVEEGALRETMEEAGARSSNARLFLMCNLPHISQVYMMYYGDLDDGIYEAGLESLEVKLFAKEEIPWKDLAFTVIEKTIKLYYEDLEKGNIDIHFDTIIKR
ncbi:NUDIX hydrolase [Gammaproteobacteria bacterium]|nr:NUDIX hydrolase [Gammaproteobacteria bacterium]